MPARKTDKVQVACPHCGHRQLEARAAISTNCRKCHQYFQLEDQRKGAARPAPPSPSPSDQRTVTCFDCGTELVVSRSAESTMCKRCSSYVDLKDYRIDSAVSKNFKTKGAFVVEPKGYVFNTEAVVEEAVIKGRFLGKLDARSSLTIYTGAEVKGNLQTAKLIIPAGNHFHWPEIIRAPEMDIEGELVANVSVSNVLRLRSDARLFGDIVAKGCLIEEGAVIVGRMEIGKE